MLPFYGRKLSRKTKNFSLTCLRKNEFFFDESKFRIIRKRINSSYSDVNLEIGFGRGENMIFQSQIKKNEIFFAIDPYLSGGMRLQRKIEILQISNILFSYLPFSEFFNLIKDVNFKRVYILFPDPWPKRKHNKRRLINKEFVNNLNKITHKNSEIFIATDDQGYSDQISKNFSREKNFKLALKRDDDLSFHDYEIYPTKYFKKAKNENRKINFFIFTK